MLTTDAFLTFADRCLDGYAAIARELGDSRINARPVGLEGANTAYGLIAHIVGVMGRWGRTANRGIVVPRDRDAEFIATGTVAEALALPELGRTRLHEDVAAAQTGAPLVNPPAHTPDRFASQGEALMHIYEEISQHLGHLAVTRDVLVADAGVSAVRQDERREDTP